MKFGIAIRNMGPESTRETILRCARLAEGAGFDAVFVSDHLCLPPDQTEGSGGRYCDVLTTLAFLAGATEKIRLGISVLILPYRPAVPTAKQVATIQELSGERLILGVGVGWMKEEFKALGVDRRQRGALATETLGVIHHLFCHEEPMAYTGRLVSFPGFVFLPRPKLPPIWVGGSGANAMSRVIRYGDGWHPMLPTEQLKPAVEELIAKAVQQQRSDLEIVVRRRLDLADTSAARARVSSDQRAGATYFIFDPGHYGNASEFGRKVDTFMSKVSR